MNTSDENRGRPHGLNMGEGYGTHSTEEKKVQLGFVNTLEVNNRTYIRIDDGQI